MCMSSIAEIFHTFVLNSLIMKNNTLYRFLSIAVFLFVCFLPARAVSSAGIKKGTFQLEKKKITAWNLSDFTSILGNAARKRDGYNKTHTYDNLGIVLFEPYVNEVPGGRVSEVQFYLSRPAEMNDVVPTGSYSGNFFIDKLKLTTFLTPEKLGEALKDWEGGSGYSTEVFNYVYKKTIYIYVTFNAAHNSVVKVSVGLKKKS